MTGNAQEKYLSYCAVPDYLSTYWLSGRYPLLLFFFCTAPGCRLPSAGCESVIIESTWGSRPYFDP